MYKFFVYAFLSIVVLTTNCFGDTTHKVRKGESLSKIATAYKVSIKAIKDANNLRDENKISIGQTLVIPAPAPRFTTYKIRTGDSLSRIAQRNGITLKELSAYNNIRNSNKIKVGQVIKIPIRGDSNAAAEQYSALPSSSLRELNAVKPKPNQWKHIVIHHSASRSGSAAAFDRFHRVERRMENGLAYHFVIGNGNGMEDGEIHVGDRWKRQIQGGHLSSYAFNQISIGICLVGDFEKTKPTSKQMEQLEALVEYLMSSTELSADRVTTHTLIHPKHTACPGRYFPFSAFKRSIGD